MVVRPQGRWRPEINWCPCFDMKSGSIVTRSKVGKAWNIYAYGSGGNQVLEVKSYCNHHHLPLAMVSLSQTEQHGAGVSGIHIDGCEVASSSPQTDPDHNHMCVVETCWECRPRRISVYSLKRPGDIVHAYTGEIPIGWALCSGPGASLLTCSLQGEVSQYTWAAGSKGERLIETRSFKVEGRRRVRGMCYVPGQDSVILSDDGFKQVLSVKLGSPDSDLVSPTEAMPTAEPNWVIGGKGALVNGKELEPEGVACDDMGRVYLADGSRVVILDAIDGSFIQEIQGDGWGDICNVGWSNTVPQLAVLSVRSPDSEYKIKCHNLTQPY